MEREFPKQVGDRFKYIWFATDFEKDEADNVLPGIGGSVYKRFGLGDEKTKNKYIPDIVKQRRIERFGTQPSPLA